jgi:hypothetical protein
MPEVVRWSSKLVLVALLLVTVQTLANNDKDKKEAGGDKNFPSLFSTSANAPLLTKMADSIYNLISLGDYGLEREVFFKAFKGYQVLQSKGALKKTDLLTICDYSQSINNKRLYVIDLADGRLLFNTFVSHGRNSGNEFATSFSNFENSNKSCLGFLVTGGTYSGKAGYSLRFDGMERGINDRVRSRAIVLHGSRFVNESFMNVRGTIGKSLGCPAVPFGLHKRIIDAIKGGSCFFINSPDQWYAQTSTIVNAAFDLSPSLQLNNDALKDGVADATGEDTKKSEAL